MKLVQKITIAVLLSAILLALVFWLGRVLFIVSDELNTFEEISWNENPWAVAQTQIELERMRVSLDHSWHDNSDQNIKDSIERIEIFWSRLEVLLFGPNNGVLKDNPSLNDLTIGILAYLQQNEANVYSLEAQFHKELKERSEKWSTEFQNNSRATYHDSSKHIDLVGEHTVATYEKIKIFLIFIAVFSIVLLGLLVILLTRNNRLLSKEKEISNMKTDFLANMSHELRTPLNGIIGSINLYKKENKESNELIDILDKSSEALLAQIDDILDYSQIEAGKIKLENIVFSLREVLIDCISIFKLKADEKKLYLDICTAQDLDIYIWGDKTKIRQIILNLISNAIKFTHTGGVTIDASYIIHKQDYEIKLSVIDTGIGIASENIKNLFTSFNQADTSIKRQFGGTGLGLSISKKLIKAMKGRLDLESVEGKGTKFIVNLNLKKGNKENFDKIKADENKFTAISNKQINFSGKKVLVVEDNIVNQKIISKILQSFNIEVFIVENGKLATQYDLSKIDLIFMDLQMPEMDGVTACGIIRDKGSDVPIVALTANATEHYKQQCEKIGMNEFLSKPFNMQKIEDIISKYFSNY